MIYKPVFFCKNTKLFLHVLVDLESLFIFLFRTEVSVPQVENPFSQFFTKSRINVCQTNTQLTRGWKCGKGENLYLKLYSPNIEDKTKKCKINYFLKDLLKNEEEKLNILVSFACPRP